jgi:Mlc titration factor MtfA (ptsG expression regulator)
MATPREDNRWLRHGATAACVLALLALLFSFWDDLGYHLRGRTADAHAVEEAITPAGFTHGGDLDDRGGTRPQYTHRLLYEYTDPDGRTWTGRHEWQGPSDRPAFQPGDRVPIQYRTDRPDVSRVSVSGPFAAGWACLLAVPLAAGIVLLAWLLNRDDRGLALVAWLGRRLPGGKRRQDDSASFSEGEPIIPFGWERAIRKNVGLYGRLPPAEQERLQRLVRGFLPGKEWVGCNGFEVTDEVKATIAAQACVLLLGAIDHDHFASVKSILVYPTTFNTATDRHGLEAEAATLGQAWYRGPVVLAWDEVLAGGRDPDGGHNVVYHEFAHQLDFAGESLEQAGAAGAEEKRRRRNDVLHREYAALVRAAETGRATLLDQYGATDPREFFAVATECFFEKPIEMEQAHRELYEVLREFYGQDPGKRLRQYRSMVESTERRDRLAGEK